ERGLKHAELGVAAAERAGDPLLRCEALAMFGLMHFVAGRGVPYAKMEEALALERSLEGSPTDPATWTVAHQLVWSGEDLERGRRHLHEYREAMRARGHEVTEVEPLWGLSVLEWRAGNWDLAARQARDLLALAAQTGAEGEEPVWDLAPTVIAAHRGQIVDARARADRALARAGEQGNRRAQAMHLWVLGFIELSGDDPAAALEHARTLLALGATQRRAKQRGAARATLEQALGTFEQLGAPLWAEKTRAELARIGGRSRSGGELTESERRIAALVGEGRSNRE